MKRTNEIDALWQKLWENPGDLDIRAVLADALQNVSDPRGEYIAHALAGKPSKLLAKHIDAWTGKLGQVVPSSRRFENGFLHSVCIDGQAKSFERSLAEPEWGTVEELHIGTSLFQGCERGLATLLARPTALRALVISEWKIGSLVEKLGKRGSFPRIEVIGSANWIPEGKVAAFPSLRVVGTRARLVPTHEALARGARLDAVVSIAADLTAADVAAFDAGSVPELRVTIGKTMNDWTAYGYEGWGVRLRKREPHADIRFGAGRYQPGSLAKILTLLGPTRRSFSIRTPNSGAAKVKAKAEIPRGLDVRFVDEPLDLWAVPTERGA